MTFLVYICLPICGGSTVRVENVLRDYAESGQDSWMPLDDVFLGLVSFILALVAS